MFLSLHHHSILLFWVLINLVVKCYFFYDQIKTNQIKHASSIQRGLSRGLTHAGPFRCEANLLTTFVHKTMKTNTLVVTQANMTFTTCSAMNTLATITEQYLLRLGVFWTLLSSVWIHQLIILQMKEIRQTDFYETPQINSFDKESAF